MRIRPVSGVVMLLASAMGTQVPVSSDSPCAGLIDHLEEHFTRARTVWHADPWDYSFMELPAWTRGASWPHEPRLFDSPAKTDRLEYDWRIAWACSSVVYRRFYLDSDTLVVTFGRIPEACSEAPALLWQTPDGRTLRRALSPLFNWNVATMWCTPHYLVFGLEAGFEGGGYAEGLALWHLPSGNLEVALAPAWTRGGDSLKVRPLVLLPEDFPAWRQAVIAEAESCLVLRGEAKTLWIRPDRRQVALLDHPSGR